MASEIPSLETTHELGGLARFGRLWLIVSNVVFTIIGLTSFVLGCVLRLKPDVLTLFISRLTSSVYVGTSDVGVNVFIESLALTFIVTGAVSVVLGVLGCLGACCKFRACLLVYTVSVLVVLILQVFGVILLFNLKSEVQWGLKSALKGTFVSSYTGDTGTDPVTLGWNYVFIQLDCCGVDNFTDVQTSSVWNRTVVDHGLIINLQTPLTCCKVGGEYPEITWPEDMHCAIVPNTTTSNYREGCYNAIQRTVLGYSPVVITIGVLMVLIELASAAAAILLLRELNSKVEVLKE